MRVSKTTILIQYTQHILLIVRMIRNIASRVQFNFAIEKKLFVYDSGERQGVMDNSLPHLHSGIRATIFGASGKIVTTQGSWENLLPRRSDSLTAAS